MESRSSNAGQQVRKKMKKYRLKGQSLLEYAFLVAIVAAAFIGMQHYIKRSVQGRVKQGADIIGEPYDSEGMRLSTITTNVNARYSTQTTSRVLDEVDNSYAVDTQVDSFEEVARTGNEQLNPW
jgi:Flp pilus assembly pilin Flp